MPEKSGHRSPDQTNSAIEVVESPEGEHNPETLFAELYRFKGYLEHVGRLLEKREGHPATHDANGKVMSPNAINRLTEQMEKVWEECGGMKDKIESALPGLLQAPESKALWETIAGKPITTLAEAESTVEALVKEAVDAFAKYRTLYKGDEAAAATLVLGLGEHPAFSDGQDRADWETQIIKRERLLNALTLIPGNHFSAHKVYQVCHPILSGEVTAEAAVACLKTLGSDFKIKRATSGRMDHIEMDPPTYTKEELNKVEVQLKRAKELLEQAQKHTPRTAQPVARTPQTATITRTPAPVRPTERVITTTSAANEAEARAAQEARDMETRINNRPPTVERTPIVISPERSAEYRDIAEVFGDRFFGMEATESALTLQNGLKLIEFTPEQKRQAETILRTFIRQPDVAQFLGRVSSGEIVRTDWQFRLQTPTLRVGGRNIPLTMQNLEQNLAPDMQVQNQGEPIYFTDWCKNEQFYTAETPTFGWVLSTNGVVDTTLSRTDDQQTVTLRAFARNAGFMFDPVTSRAKPIETLWRFIMDLRVNGKRILTEPNRYDRSAVLSSEGHLVHVGGCDAKGAIVSRNHPDGAGGNLGASFSRRSGP